MEAKAVATQLAAHLQLPQLYFCSCEMLSKMSARRSRNPQESPNSGSGSGPKGQALVACGTVTLPYASCLGDESVCAANVRIFIIRRIALFRCATIARQEWAHQSMELLRGVHKRFKLQLDTRWSLETVLPQLQSQPIRLLNLPKQSLSIVHTLLWLLLHLRLRLPQAADIFCLTRSQ